MLKTLDRYQKCSYGAVEVNKPAKELEVYKAIALICLTHMIIAFGPIEINNFIKHL